MTALDFLRYLTDTVFVVLFVLVLIRAVRRPTAAAIDTALFFGALALAVSEGLIVAWLGVGPQPVLSAMTSAAFVSLPFWLLRLLDDFIGVPRGLLVAAGVGLIASVLAVFAFIPPPLPVTLGIVAYFVVFTIYAAVAFGRVAMGATGVNRRRLQSISFGSVVLGLLIAVAGVQAALPADAGVLGAVIQILALVWGLAYAVGFAPPQALRRLWLEPELRSFLALATRLPRIPTIEAMIHELERGAGGAIGAQVQIALADATGTMYFRQARSAEPFPVGPGSTLPARRAFDEQRTIYMEDLTRQDPANTATYRGRAVSSAIIAPITAGERRLGVLMAVAPRAPLFAEDDVALAGLLADQAAVVLESRTLIDQATEVRAHEQATRLKEDFLSAAAHELKTPLTTLVAQTQFLEHRSRRDPTASADPESLARISREAKRLGVLVEELLDASRLEQGTFAVRREPIDLLVIANDVAARPRISGHKVVVESQGPTEGLFDGVRITQLLDNLVENGVKYSQPDRPVGITLAGREGEVTIEVEDGGIGIPPEDVPHVFERFRRARNVDDRRYAGMGLGLYISRGIVEQHGGTISIDSTVGVGTVVRVILPKRSPDA